MRIVLLILLMAVFAFPDTKQIQERVMQTDPHSFARPDEAVVKHLDLNLTVDFTTKQLSGFAVLHIENKKGVRTLHLDSGNLTIKRVALGEQETTFHLGDSVEYLGQDLAIEILPTTKLVRIDYATHGDAAALQWLEPA